MIPIDASFVLLAADLTVEQALRRLALHPRARWVIVRRLREGRIYWYSFPAPQLRTRLEVAAPTEPVGILLDLHEWSSTRSHLRAAVDETALRPGHVLLAASGAPAGVFAPPPQAAARGPRAEPPPAAPGGPAAAAPVPPPAAAPRRRAAPGAGEGVGAGAEGTRRRGTRPLRKAKPVRRERAAGAAPAPGGEAAFRAWPDLAAPPSIEDGREFEFVVGFAAERVAGVAGDEIVVGRVPPRFDLDLEITAVGFECAAGFRHTLRVERDQPTVARLALRLKAAVDDWPDGESTKPRVLGVTYAYRGEVCGRASRNILVVRPGATLPTDALDAPQAFTASTVPGLPVWVRAGAKRADLTVALSRYDGDPAKGNFVWSFHSPHPVPMPAPVRREIDDDAASFARAITADIVALGDRQSRLLGAHVKGAGRRIADHVPAELWTALAAVARVTKAQRRTPDLLLLTEEWCIPWELAWMPVPLDPGVFGCLGAQANVGRWIFGEPAVSAQPESEVQVRNMVVLYGDYDGDNALPDAIREKDDLVKQEHALPFGLKDDAVLAVLDGKRPDGGTQILHFACHGVGDPKEPGVTHLMMPDESPLTDDVLRGVDIGERSQPFMFLNACEAGTAGDELGMASGFVGAAIQAGFRGFVGALWEVESATAREMAVAFYRRAIDRGASVGATLRALRARFDPTRDDVPNDTYLAYVYYGHPALRLVRAGVKRAARVSGTAVRARPRPAKATQKAKRVTKPGTPRRGVAKRGSAKKRTATKRAATNRAAKKRAAKPRAAPKRTARARTSSTGRRTGTARRST